MDAETTESELVDIAQKTVIPGFVTRSDAVERVREALELDETDPRSERVVELAWSRRTAQQSTWEGRSDHDRLAAAFRRLEARGFVTRMNFTCCNRCGTDEIDDERTALDTAAEYPYRETMYTFFHQQDAERLVDEPAALFLTYSADGGRRRTPTRNSWPRRAQETRALAPRSWRTPMRRSGVESWRRCEAKDST